MSKTVDMLQLMNTTTSTGLTVDQLIAFLTSEKAAGRLAGDNAVLVVTGYEGQEHLTAKASTIQDDTMRDDGGSGAYALLSYTGA